MTRSTSASVATTWIAAAVLGAASLSIASAAGPVAGRPNCPPATGNSLDADRCAELRLIASRPGLARRVGDRLVLTLDDGRRVTIADRPPAHPDDVEVVRYAFVAALDAPRLFQVQATFYEGGRLSVVSRATGRRWELGGDALEASPDGRRIVAWSSRNGYDDGALEIWRLDGDRLVLEFRGLTGSWWPTEVRWIDASTVAYRRASGDDPDAPVTVARRLRRDATPASVRWRAEAAR